jgi:hypothetical protein
LCSSQQKEIRKRFLSGLYFFYFIEVFMEKEKGNTTTFLSLILPFLLIGCLTASNQLLARSVEEKVKEAIDDIADSLKSKVDKLGEDVAAIQDYLEHYSWKGVIQDEATSGPETLSHLMLNGHSRVAVVRPGETIQAAVQCSFNADVASSVSVYRVVLGVKDVGPQTTVATRLGASDGESVEQFHLTAPNVPGFYQVRFRTVNALLESSALNGWFDEQGRQPDGSTTIGIIYVK